MNHQELTREYLDRVRAQGIDGSELVGDQPTIKLLTTNYKGFLSRPLFLGHTERVRLMADLELVRTALLALPDRLFDGDLAAFARAAGMDEVLVSAVCRSRSDQVSSMARMDMYLAEDGFRLLEANMSSALGGMDNAVMGRALLGHPALSRFARERGLACMDTHRALFDTMYRETGYGAADAPVVAVADWPTSYLSRWAPILAEWCAHFRRMGVDAHPCHIGELTYRNGGVWLAGRKVDIVLRIFIIEDLLESPAAPAVAEPLLNAAAAGHVQLFVPLDVEVFASKANLAMLSDDRHRHLFSAEQLAAIDRVVPWTRMVRPGEVTLADGSRVDLLTYAVEHRAELALKHAVSHGGAGVVVGWDDEVSAAEWKRRVAAAVNGPYVLQRRIRPTAELFPGDGGTVDPWLVTWGVFMMADGFAGVYARAKPSASNDGVVNGARGAFSGSCLYEPEPAAGPD